jgi:hypothetical protein
MKEEFTHQPETPHQSTHTNRQLENEQNIKVLSILRPLMNITLATMLEYKNLFKEVLQSQLII